MAKKSKTAAAPATEQQAENEANEILVGLLRAADDAGVSLVEADWRAMTEVENRLAVVWINARRTGQKAILPMCLRPFATEELLAEADQYLANQSERKKVLMPCIFKKPGYDRIDGGGLRIRVAVRIPDTNLGDRPAREVFGKKHCRIEISRRAFGEWGQGEIVDDGDRRIITFEADIMRYGWTDGHYLISFLCDEESFQEGTIARSGLDEAIGWSGKQGSLRVEVLCGVKGGEDPISGSDAPAAETPKAKPKKEKPLAGAKPLPGIEQKDESFEIGKNANAVLVVNLRQSSDGRWSADWKGMAYVGHCAAAEPKFRTTREATVEATLGNAIDHWSVWDSEDEKAVISSAKAWMQHLGAGKKLEEFGK